jgi:hypothetical protein
MLGKPAGENAMEQLASQGGELVLFANQPWD